MQFDLTRAHTGISLEKSSSRVILLANIYLRFSVCFVISCDGFSFIVVEVTTYFSGLNSMFYFFPTVGDCRGRSEEDSHLFHFG